MNGGAAGRRRIMAVSIAALTLTSGCAGAPQPSGLELSGFDRSVRPADDLYRFADGTWERNTQIPPDLSRVGSFTTLALQAQADQRTLIEAAAGNPAAPGSAGDPAAPDDDSHRDSGAGANARKIGDLYASFMDTAHLDQLGATPLRPYFDAVQKLSGPADLVRYLGASEQFDGPDPIGLGVGQDVKDATHYITSAEQDGLSLPDRDYYLSADPAMAGVRDRYRDYTVTMLGLAGVPDPPGAAGRILDLETKLAAASWTKVRNRDDTATYNKFTVPDATAATGIDWAAYLDAAGIHQPDLVIAQPSFFTALGGLLTTVPLDTWKQYLEWHLIQQYAPYLSSAFVDTRFDFVGKVLDGRQQNLERWRRGVSTVNDAMGEALGRLYVDRYFPDEAKRRADTLVHTIIDAYRSSIDGLDWMSPPSKAVARQKLDKLAVKIGYPAAWKDYSSLDITRGDLIGDLDRAARWEHQRDVAKLGRPVDRTEWFMTPQTVNAYYSPAMNEIVFPAAILQPPFFDARVDDAVNYGAIGSVIGHEISHAFDDQGAKFDPDGNLRDWLAPADAAAFAAKTQALAVQYGGYSPLPGLHVNGRLTLGENIADLSGLTVANRAYHASLHGGPAPVLDTFTGEQRFFLGFAQIWRTKERDESLRTLLLTDPHSPGEFRCDGVVTNVDAFYTAFDVRPGDKLYKPPADRIHIW